ncbi:hypothetical protein [Mycobacterium kansasii]|uniref:Uncharacterized protein n=2 Tax=Mycobacterium kansasii TaxID=1768 RepID=A0A653EMI1_MYCKA|nr:hypothetical protein [Mycobacterium kansasii]AGZ54316.1 hypothetical protein MKAN_18015 [Mycobacterium kansasii ATCC 12478]KZS81370.1 hypothetical protein A4G30_16975 [Mycobacterium kansasii]VAZ58511.1 hypothetical protein LAUMK22_00299 [Mycobacterium kansasii]VTO98719.1 hypothetical protein BIN_B_01578 [Mycobacterium kansasii]
MHAGVAVGAVGAGQTVGTGVAVLRRPGASGTAGAAAATNTTGAAATNTTGTAVTGQQTTVPPVTAHTTGSTAATGHPHAISTITPSAAATAKCGIKTGVLPLYGEATRAAAGASGTARSHSVRTETSSPAAGGASPVNN